MPFHRSALLALAWALGCLTAFPESSAMSAEWSGPLTLQGALQRALVANPKLRAADQDIGIAAGRYVQAGAIPNPELSFELDSAFGTGEFRGLNSAEKTVGLGQLIELGGKREARLAAGAAEWQGTFWQREAVRLEVVSDTAVGFFNVLGGQRKLQIFDEQISALDRLLPLLQRRIDAGASSPGEIARVQVAAALVRAERERARTALAIARRELAVLMGAPLVAFSYVAGDLNQVGRLPPFAALLRHLEKSPQLIRWTAVRAQKDAELLSARLKPIPDLRLDLAWKQIREPGELGARTNQAMRLGASITIPLWDQNLGNVAAARAERAKVEAERDASRAALILMLAKAYDSQSGAIREIEVLRGSALPNARRAMETIEDGYGQGRFTLLDVLDSQNTAAQVAQREQEALIIFHTTVATIQGLTGISLGIGHVRRQ
jgi:cobalt-zinc-cadmium efflux system outer membrane protein